MCLGSPMSATCDQVREAEILRALAELAKGTDVCGISRGADFTDVVNYKLTFVIVVCFLLKDRLQGDIKKQQEIIISLRSLLLQVSAWHKQVQIFLLPCHCPSGRSDCFYIQLSACPFGVTGYI